jgi:helicase
MEEVYQLYGGAIRKLAEGFSWLADSLAAVAESLDWSKSENKKEELTGIKILSERLAWGVEEEGLKLARLNIPGLSRSYIRALLREGYDDEKCLQELSEEELSKIVPKRLAERIKKRFPAVLSSSFAKNDKPKTRNPKLETGNPISETDNFSPASVNSHPHTLNTKDQGLTTILQIDQHRPDRIIFQGKEIKVTAKEFSLIHLLTQHPEQVMSYNEILDELWKDEEDAIYNRVSYHFSKIRSTILKTIGKSKRNKEKVKNIFKVISRRGIMLNLEEDKLKIN